MKTQMFCSDLNLCSGASVPLLHCTNSESKRLCQTESIKTSNTSLKIPYLKDYCLSSVCFKKKKIFSELQVYEDYGLWPQRRCRNTQSKKSLNHPILSRASSNLYPHQSLCTSQLFMEYSRLMLHLLQQTICRLEYNTFFIFSKTKYAQFSLIASILSFINETLGLRFTRYLANTGYIHLQTEKKIVSNLTYLFIALPKQCNELSEKKVSKHCWINIFCL